MKLFIESTRITPFITYSPNQNILSLRGRSSPENPIEFYKPVFEFIEQFKNSAASGLCVNVCLEYFNTSSTKVIYSIFKALDKMNNEFGLDIAINWFYEEWDDDMMEIGEDFSQDLGLKFNLIELSDEISTSTYTGVAA